MKGHAVVFTNKLQVAYQEVEIPDPGIHDVLVDIQYSWISVGTESSFLRGDRIAGERMYTEGDPWPFPNVAGYQKVGVVRSVGSEVTEVKPGDRVFVAMSKVSGMFFSQGGHLQPSVSSMDQIWKIPDEASLVDYSALVLAQVGYNCGIRPAIQEGELAVVIGDGLVGHWTAQTLVHRGAKVVMLGRHDFRLKYTEPPIITIHTKRTDPAAYFSGQTITAIIDTVGAMDTVYALQPFLRRESHIVSAGFLGDRGRVDIQKLREKEITLHTPSGWTKPRMDQTLRGIREGWLKTSPLITHRFAVEEASKAWELILGNKESSLGIILDWTRAGN
jgi:bacteriochlorophyllide a dehydrogenase